MMIRKITLLRSASMFWTIISSTTKKPRCFVVVGQTMGQQHYINYGKFSVVPMLGQYQWPNNGVLPQLQLLPRVGPTIDCYLGAYSTISIPHNQIPQIRYDKLMEVHFKATAPLPPPNQQTENRVGGKQPECARGYPLQ